MVFDTLNIKKILISLMLLVINVISAISLNRPTLFPLKSVCMTRTNKISVRTCFINSESIIHLKDSFNAINALITQNQSMAK